MSGAAEKKQRPKVCDCGEKKIDSGDGRGIACPFGCEKFKKPHQQGDKTTRQYRSEAASAIAIRINRVQARAAADKVELEVRQKELKKLGRATTGGRVIHRRFGIFPVEAK